MHIISTQHHMRIHNFYFLFFGFFVGRASEGGKGISFLAAITGEGKKIKIRLVSQRSDAGVFLQPFFFSFFSFFGGVGIVLEIWVWGVDVVVLRRAIKTLFFFFSLFSGRIMLVGLHGGAAT